MKYISMLIALVITKISFGQIDTNAVLSAELPEIIITAKKGDARQHKILNLAKYSSSHAVAIRCNENIGIMIPQHVENEIYLKDVVIPMRKGIKLNEKNLQGNEYYYYLILVGKETNRYQITPKKADYSDKKIRLNIDQSFIVSEPVNQFYFFLVPVCSAEDYATDNLFRFTFRFKSRLTYQLREDKVELLNFRDRDPVTFGNDRFLNWKIKVEYSYDNK